MDPTLIHSLKPRVPSASRKRGLVLIALVALLLGLALSAHQLERNTRDQIRVAPLPPFDPQKPPSSLAGEPRLDLSAVSIPQPIEIRRGQTVGELLGELGLAPMEVHAAVASLREHVDLRRVRPGDTCVAYLDSDLRLASFRLSVEGKGWIELERDEQSWDSIWHEFERERRLRVVRGELSDFLEASVRRAGGDSQLAYAMARILQWDLDFNRDLRLGDRFEVLYEEQWIDGQRKGVGEVVALAYDNQGRRHEAYRHGEGGYYDGNGRPLRKMFRRSPLDFSRITSGFTHKRFHPILKVNRPHYGVDYGAPTGTQVHVTAHGVVTFVGTSGGAGKMVQVRHSDGYETAYLHLSRFAQGLHIGSRVRQDDVVGYVGSTGLATAPHLDYRVKRQGRWIDPLSLTKDGPQAEALAQHELTRFLADRDVLRESLATGVPPSGWSYGDETAAGRTQLANAGGAPKPADPSVRAAR